MVGNVDWTFANDAEMFAKFTRSADRGDALTQIHYGNAKTGRAKRHTVQTVWKVLWVYADVATTHSVSIAALQNIAELLMEVKMAIFAWAAQQNFLWQMER